MDTHARSANERTTPEPILSLCRITALIDLQQQLLAAMNYGRRGLRIQTAAYYRPCWPKTRYNVTAKEMLSAGLTKRGLLAYLPELRGYLVKSKRILNEK